MSRIRLSIISKISPTQILLYIFPFSYIYPLSWLSKRQKTCKFWHKIHMQSSYKRILKLNFFVPSKDESANKRYIAYSAVKQWLSKIIPSSLGIYLCKSHKLENKLPPEGNRIVFFYSLMKKKLKSSGDAAAAGVHRPYRWV